ncbi:hypothetical protein ACTFIZ_006684 [Dictyostelium cf. discoideum]
MGKRKTRNNTEKEMEAYYIPKSSKTEIKIFLQNISANVARDAEIDFTDYEKVTDHTAELVKLLEYELDNKKFKLAPPKNKETANEEKQQSKKSLGLDEEIRNANSYYRMLGDLIKVEKEEHSKELNKLNILKEGKGNCETTKKIVKEHREMKEKEKEETKEYLSRNHKSNFLSEKYGKYIDPADDLPFLIPIGDDF